MEGRTDSSALLDLIEDASRGLLSHLRQSLAGAPPRVEEQLITKDARRSARAPY
jgi:hypothetical protein